MNKIVEQVTGALKDRLSKNIPEHGDCKLSAKFKAEISETMETLLELCDEDDLDGLLAFSSLLELAMNEKSIEGLYDYLSNYEG